MKETRAVAHLPQVEIEIRHKELETENAEIVAITIKATPNLQTVADWLAPTSFMPMTVMGPWVAWQQAAYAMWRPWLELMGSHPLLDAPKLPAQHQSPGS